MFLLNQPSLKMQTNFEEKVREADYKYVKKHKNNLSVDFSFNNFEIFDIAFKNDFHLNFF